MSKIKKTGTPTYLFFVKKWRTFFRKKTHTNRVMMCNSKVPTRVHSNFKTKLPI